MELTPEESIQLAELDMEDMRKTVERIVKSMDLLTNFAPRSVRILGLARAIELQVPPAAQAVFAAVAIEMLAAERSDGA